MFSVDYFLSFVIDLCPTHFYSFLKIGCLTVTRSLVHRRRRALPSTIGLGSVRAPAVANRWRWCRARLSAANGETRRPPHNGRHRRLPLRPVVPQCIRSYGRTARTVRMSSLFRNGPSGQWSPRRTRHRRPVTFNIYTLPTGWTIASVVVIT